MLIGGIYFGKNTIWDEIAADIKATELEMDKAFDRIKEELEGDEEPDELDMLVESLLNYKDVLEGKVWELEEGNKKLKEALGISGQQKEELMNIIGENNTEIEKLHAEIERQDELIERLEKNDGSVMYNQLLGNTEGEARELFVRHCFYNLKCVPVNQKCDCGNLKNKIEELQSEVRDLTAENVKIGAMNENLKKLLETSIEERDNLKNALRVKEHGNVLGDKVFKELKEKYETADLEREHLKTELDKIKGTKKELEAALMATIGTVQRLSAELVKTGKE